MWMAAKRVMCKGRIGNIAGKHLVQSGAETGARPGKGRKWQRIEDLHAWLLCDVSDS